MKLLAENGYKFYSPESKNHIQNFILQARNPRIADVEERILLDKQSQSDS